VFVRVFVAMMGRQRCYENRETSERERERERGREIDGCGSVIAATDAAAAAADQ